MGSEAVTRQITGEGKKALDRKEDREENLDALCCPVLPLVPRYAPLVPAHVSL